MNDDKTELIAVGAKSKISQVIPNLTPVSISGCDIPFSQSVRTFFVLSIDVDIKYLCHVHLEITIPVCWALRRLKNNGYDPQKDQINTLDRRTQTTIFHLRTGHCGLRKHLKRLGLADSAHCECGFEEQTPEHILQTCPHLETVRQQFWPEETEVDSKLWG